MPVVNQLAADGAMHPIGGLRKIIDLHVRPVFAEAVGEHAVGRFWPIKIEHGPRLEYANGLHRYLLPRAIADLHINLRENRLRAHSQVADEVGLAGRSGVGHRDLGSRAMVVRESRPFYFMLRLIAGPEPAMIHLR